MSRPLVLLAVAPVIALFVAGAAAQTPVTVVGNGAPIAVQPIQIGPAGGSGTVDLKRAQGQSEAWQPAAPGAAPAPLGGCNAGGCWDSQGNRYNSTGDGSRFVSPEGRMCEKSGQFIRCN